MVKVNSGQENPLALRGEAAGEASRERVRLHRSNFCVVPERRVERDRRSSTLGAAGLGLSGFIQKDSPMRRARRRGGNPGCVPPARPRSSRSARIVPRWEARHSRVFASAGFSSALYSARQTPGSTSPGSRGHRRAMDCASPPRRLILPSGNQRRAWSRHVAREGKLWPHASG